MTETIGPGSVVEFIGPDEGSYGLPSGLLLRAHYVVAEIAKASRVLPDDDFYRLEGQPGRWGWYWAETFRPAGGAAIVAELFGEALKPKVFVELEPA